MFNMDINGRLYNCLFLVTEQLCSTTGYLRVSENLSSKQWPKLKQMGCVAQ